MIVVCVRFNRMIIKKKYVVPIHDLSWNFFSVVFVVCFGWRLYVSECEHPLEFYSVWLRLCQAATFIFFQPIQFISASLRCAPIIENTIFLAFIESSIDRPTYLRRFACSRCLFVCFWIGNLVLFFFLLFFFKYNINSMSMYIRTCFIVVLSANEIICRSVESSTMSNSIDAVNRPNITLPNGLLNTTDPAPRSFDICEKFENDNGDAESLILHDREFVVTVVMKLSWQLWLRQVTLLGKLEARFYSAGYTNVRFMVLTRNETNVQRIRHASPLVDVILVKNTQINQFSMLEDRSIYILDDCGRIVYIIHFPYSSVQKPFVKAAVLSTIYDLPCGRCKAIVSAKIEQEIC